MVKKPAKYIPISDRKLAKVYIADLNTIKTAGKNLASARVEFQITNWLNEPDGPSVSLEVAIDIDLNDSIESIHKGLLSRAADVLNKVGGYSVEDTYETWRDTLELFDNS